MTSLHPPPPLGQQAIDAPPPPTAAGAVGNLSSLDSARLAARLIDAGVLFAALLPVELLVGPLSWSLTLGVLLLSVLYFFVAEALWGQTIGKRLLDLRVVRRDGSAASVNEVAARNVVRVVEEPVIALVVLVASGRKRRQRVGDLLAGTTVARSDGTRPPAPSPLLYVYPAIWLMGAVLFGLLVEPI